MKPEMVRDQNTVEILVAMRIRGTMMSENCLLLFHEIRKQVSFQHKFILQEPGYLFHACLIVQLHLHLWYTRLSSVYSVIFPLSLLDTFL